MKANSHAHRVPLVLLAVYVLLFVVLGIAPYDRAVWWAENIPIVATAVTLCVMHRRGIQFSNLAYVLNDRIAHFSVGFYAIGLAELLMMRRWASNRITASLFGIFTIGTIAAVYEIIEWIYAVTQGGSAGAAFLGSQGDIWDAQKDMLADLSGSVFAIAAY